MAFRKGGSKRPTQFIAVTATVRKGKYVKGPAIGLWEGDGGKGPIARGSIKDDYLAQLIRFLRKHSGDSVSFAVFESNQKFKKKSRDEDDEDEDDEEEDDEDEDNEEEEEDDEEEEKHSRRSTKKSSKSGGKSSKKKGKKSDWDFDEDDD